MKNGKNERIGGVPKKKGKRHTLAEAIRASPAIVLIILIRERKI